MTYAVEALAPGNPPFDDLAAILKAAGDPLRLEILRTLSCDSFGVMELARMFDTRQSGMSHHLKVLATAGLVASRREGNSIFYRRAWPAPDDHCHPLLCSLYQTLDQRVLSRDVQARLALIQAEREQASRQFFADNAAKFRAQQDLIASYPVYAAAVAELLDNTPLADTSTALEVGPGEGEFLAELCSRFSRVIALDNAQAMLDKARHTAARLQLSNLQFICGDTGTARRELAAVDCVVINMVLHHVPSPAAIFDDISALLRPGAALLVTDLCHHDQHWARDACGDQWLGFEPDDLTRWAEAAGLQCGQSQFMALRNGFQIQLRQFFKPAAALRPGHSQEHADHV
jgi:ArsR family transcriptional regulator